MITAGELIAWRAARQDGGVQTVLTTTLLRLLDDAEETILRRLEGALNKIIAVADETKRPDEFGASRTAQGVLDECVAIARKALGEDAQP